MNYGIVLVAVSAFATGCSTIHPIPVKHPELLSSGETTILENRNIDFKVTAQGLIQKIDNTQNLEANSLADLKNYAKTVNEKINESENLKTGYPVKWNEFSSVFDFMLIHKRTYQDEATKKRKLALKSSDTGFIAGVTAVVAGVTKAPATAIGGGAVAAGSSMFDERYLLNLQAENYEKAAKAMQCLWSASLSIPKTGIETYKTFANNNITDSKSNILLIARSSIFTIRDKLDSLQIAFKLGEPNADKLRDLFSNPVQQTTAATEAELSTLITGGNKSSADDPLAAPLSRYKQETSLCIAQFD